MYSPRVTSFSRRSLYSAKTKNSSVLSSRRRSSTSFSVRRNSSLNLSLQTSQIIEECESHTVENFGTPLPVLAVEAISTVEPNGCKDISAKLNSSGWAWLVCGRRLFIWRFKLNPGQHMFSALGCRELTLPPSDLAHKADLVCVLCDGDRQVPSAIAVSPEGMVRYWPSIAQDSMSVEMCVELQGQECFSLINCQSSGCALATTTGTLMLITPPKTKGENTLSCRNLTAAKGLLARFGRRMSSFVFGGIPSQAVGSRQVRILFHNNMNNQNSNWLFALTGTGLQLWGIGDEDSDQLIMNCEIDVFFREKFMDQVWTRDVLHSSQQLKLWLIDIQLSKYGLIVLASAVSPEEPQKMCFALGILDIHGQEQPTSLSDFIVLSHTDNFQIQADEDDDMLPDYRLLVADYNADYVYIYKEHTILCLPLYASEEVDKIEFRQKGDHIIGAGEFDGTPLFFSNCYGIVAVKSSSSSDDSVVMNNTFVGADGASVSETFNLTCTPAELESLATSGNKTQKLKAALFAYCRKNLVQSQSILQETFPALLEGNEAQTNVDLDLAVSQLSQQMIDDFPIVDPRWAETLSSSTTSISSSMIILHQLEDKLKAHQQFVKFLHATGLWQRLQSVSVGLNTRRLLCEHEEKLVAARALRLLQPQYMDLIESAIKAVLNTRCVAPAGELTHRDIFYQEVSRIEEIVGALLDVEESTLSANNAYTIVTTVSSINVIILHVLRQIAQYRQTRSSEISLVLGPSEIANLPLSSSRDPSLLRSLLTRQCRFTLEHAVGASHDAATRGTMYQQTMDLIDCILDGYRCQIQYLESTGSESAVVGSVRHRYEQDRTGLILLLLEAEQYDRAAALAEKYLDYEVLVRLCEATENSERLQRYVLQFEEQGFSEFIYNWYLREGKRGKLLSQSVLHRSSLESFLEDHSNLSWLHDIQLQRFAKAHKTLRSSAENETDILARKKTMLSLGKLCCLASDMLAADIETELTALNEQETLVAYQETLPATLLDNCGMTMDSMRVLSPVELIELYVTDDNVDANEYDFKKALELLNFVDKKSSKDDLCLHIWSQCVLKDRWDDFEKGVDDPLKAGSQTVFFRTVELVFTSGMDLSTVLPKKETLLENSVLSSVSKNVNFQFLIKACYEHVESVML